MELRTIRDLDLAGKKVFLRLDLNVPLKNGVVQDDTRLRAAVPTLEFLLKSTHKICVASHLGRPKGEPDPQFSLEPVGEVLAKLTGKEVIFVRNYVEEPVDQFLDRLEPDQIVLLENLRFHPGEKKNDFEFSANLMKDIDFFVNDAFGTAHRAHASVVGAGEQVDPPRRAAGFLIEKEVQALGGLLSQPEAPFTVIMGGAKVSDKVPVILSLLERCNHLIIGGAMAYTLLKAKGVDVGSSRVEEDQLATAETIFRNAEKRRVQIHLPVDHVCAKEFSETAAPEAVADANIPAGLMGLDIGPKSIELFARVIRDSKMVLWNGPMGVFEWDSFAQGSMAVAKALADCPGKTVIGGGDSVSAVNKAGVADQMDHVSTGGGASLEFLEGKTLPGIKILQK